METCSTFAVLGEGGVAPPPDLPTTSPSNSDLKEGLGTTKIIDTIPVPARPTAPENFPINNVKYVASYNWTDAEKPTMVAPGVAYSSPLNFFLISAIISSQVRQLYRLGVPVH